MRAWRIAAFAVSATALASGCPAPAPPIKPTPPPVVDDRADRIAIAIAEATREPGLHDIVEHARAGSPHLRMLALRALGRIGTPTAIAALDQALADPDQSIARAALAARGIAAALDDAKPDADVIDHALALACIPGSAAPAGCVAPTPGELALILEALGRTIGHDDELAIVQKLAGAGDHVEVTEATALAFARLGRRKIALVPDARAWLVDAAASTDVRVRYAATYALGREHEPTADPAVSAVLAIRVGDDDAEVRAVAIAGIVRRGIVPTARTKIEAALRDRDWRVAIEAVRALAGEHGDDAGRTRVASELDRHWNALAHDDERAAQVVIEALRLLVGHPLEASAAPALEALASQAGAASTPPALARGWIECLALAAAQSLPGAPNSYNAVIGCGHGNLPDRLRLPIIAELVRARVGDASARRAGMRVLLGHADARVRAAGIAALPAMWRDSEDAEHQATIETFAAELRSPEIVVVGTAVETAEAMYDAIGTDPLRSALDTAVIARARAATGPDDLEIAEGLFELIGKRKITAGVDACRGGLALRTAAVRAATECLRALGEVAAPPAAVALEPPPVEVRNVIGRPVTWHLTTTRGEIAIELHPEVAPWNVATIVALTQRGFYDGTELHRDVPGFVIQGGDPTASGWGGAGFTTPAEPATLAEGLGFVAGGVGIADAGRDSGGSQWFVMHARAAHLDGRYTWIGRVVAGQDVADALLIGDRVIKATVDIRY